jgi:hypothetical protein
MKYLLTTTENYRVNSEEEATQLIENAKKEAGYILTKSSTQYKERKQKGEVVDYYWKVSLTKHFNNEKEPERDVEIEYKEGSAF